MKYINLLVALFLVSSFLAQPNTNAQTRAEKVVSTYAREKFKDQNYKSYGYGDLIKISPQEIVEIDNIKAEIDSIRNATYTDSMLAYYDSILKEKIAYVKANKLFPTYELQHRFIQKELHKQPILNDFTFTLYPDGKIKDINKVLSYELTDKEYDYYYTFHREYSLIKIYDAETRAYNATMYEYLKDLYDNEVADKAAALSTILSIVQTFDKKDYFDSTAIVQNEIRKYFKKNLNIERYNAPLFTKIQPILDSGEITAYKVFLKQTIDDKEIMHYFEFDVDYILRNVLVVEPPYEQHFIKNE